MIMPWLPDNTRAEETVYSYGKLIQQSEAQPMCENADKAIHLKTLIAEIKVLYAQWRKARKNKMPASSSIYGKL